MPYHHEYHLAATAEKEPVHSSVAPAVNGKSKFLTSRLFLGVLGIFAGVVAIVTIISLCIHPRNLATDDLISDEINLVRNSSLNASLLNFELLEDFNEDNEYERRFIRSLSASEKDSISQLRLAVEDKVTHSYMKTANYLARWLRARDWDLEDAKDMLLDHLEWRIEYEIDSVLTDNFTFFEHEFPVYNDGVANEGGPVYSVNADEWDLRKVAIGGYRREFLRYAFRIFEGAIDVGYKMQSEGIILSHGMLIMNINNYSFAKHGCFSCVSVIGSFLFGIDENYPGWLNPILLINTSELADALVNLLLPYVNGENRKAIEVFGYNKDEWQKRVLTFVAADQIRTEFGGTKVGGEE